MRLYGILFANNDDMKTASRFSPIGMLLVGALLAFAVLAFVPQEVFAQTSELEDVGSASGLSTEDLTTVIGRIISVVLGTLGVILLIIMIYAGFLWMTAGGNPDQVEKAKKWMVNGVVGLIIILASYAITAFIVNALGGTLTGGGRGSGSGTYSSIERNSGSLGSGGINYHYPARNATDIPRNTRILVTFKSAMNLEDFIDGYNVNGTPEDISDDTASTALNADNILIYRTEDGASEALTSEEVSVSFTEDLKTFSFAPEDYLGSSTEDVSYTVFIDDAVETVDGDQIVNTGGYEWSFEVSTELDLDPPTVVSVSPRAGREVDRNIVVQITFSEAIDPTSATGTRESASGFSNIQTYGLDGVALTGVYAISNSYKTVTFATDDACGTNSCGETMYCLPGEEDVTVDVMAATVDEANAPQAESFPYDGVVDIAANALDGDGDGDAGDDYSWSFTTTDDINLDAPVIEAIAPNVLEEDVALDQDITILFDSIMWSSTLSSEYLSLTSNPSHEMWYSVDNAAVDTDGNLVSSSGGDPVATRATIRHGVFLETTEDELTGESCTTAEDCDSGQACNSDGQCYEEGETFLYAAEVTSDVKNEYQNCYVPGEGPDGRGGSCGTSSAEPFCCNGVASSSSCDYFSS